MNKYLKQLVDLSKIDREIDEFEPKIEKIKKAFQDLIHKKKEIELKIEKNKTDKLNEELNIKKNELHIEELGNKLQSIKVKSATVKTQKEAKALELEEEIARDQIKIANEEIERLEKIVTIKMQDISLLEKELENIEKEIIEKEAKVNRELKEIEKNREIVYKKKHELVSKIPQKILEFYQKIKKWAKNTTVVPVRKQACYGCYMKLNNHIYAEVLKGEEIKNCPHCGRILYIETEEEIKED